MTETKQEKLVELLKELRKVGEMQGSAVVSRDGLRRHLLQCQLRCRELQKPLFLN